MQIVGTAIGKRLVPHGRRPRTEISESYEALAQEAVGAFIEFWGFKHNHGRVWTLLYLRNEPVSAAELMRCLGLTKGAVSMLIRDLEYWGVVKRLRREGERTQRFVAETDLIKLISRVFREREANVLHHIKVDLLAAERLAKTTAGVTPDTLDRVRRLRMLAETAEQAVVLFISTAKLSLTALFSLMRRSL